MKIDIFKDKIFWSNLQNRNSHIIDVSKKYFKFAQAGTDYDLVNNVISQWFNPEYIKLAPASRTYPRIAPEQLKDCYNLILYNSNYLCIFLSHVLNFDKKTTVIEDYGAGVGHLLVYLNSIGFNNFNVIEDFSQCTEFCLQHMMQKFNINFTVNKNINPHIVNISGIPFILIEKTAVERYKNTDLIICYYNNGLEAFYNKELISLDFKFLCQDEDNFSVAYCKSSKYDEYKEKLKDFVV